MLHRTDTVYKWRSIRQQIILSLFLFQKPLFPLLYFRPNFAYLEAQKQKDIESVESEDCREENPSQDFPEMTAAQMDSENDPVTYQEGY